MVSYSLRPAIDEGDDETKRRRERGILRDRGWHLNGPGHLNGCKKNLISSFEGWLDSLELCKGLKSNFR